MSRTVTFLGLLVLAAVVLAAGFSLYPVKPADAQPAVSKTVVAPTAPVSFRFAKPEADRPEEEPSAPISLTASDGTGLSLVALEADGVLEPPLAFTELHLTFENPRNEVIEGRFRIALPPGAALSRFAMKIDDAWQEGEVVERQRARQAYEDFLHRRQDPALLEQEAGNEFSARVFPIPARGQKELIVSYSHALVRAEEPYVLPLLGLSKVGQLDVRVLLGDRPATGAAASNLGGEVSERRVVELHKRDWTPDRDFEIAQDRSKERVGRAGLRHANLAVVRVAAPVEAVPQEIKGLYVLLDSSASRALGYATQVRRLAELITALRDGAGGTTPLGIAAFDQEVVPLFEGTAAGFGPEEVQRLRGRRPLGASDLQGALAWLGDHLDQLGQRGGKYPRVLLITDGVATAGQTETRDLKAAVKALGEKGVERLDVLAVGGLRDEAVLHELTTGNLKNDGQRLDGSAPLTEIGRRLTLATRSGIKVAVEGATWVWPDTLDGVQPGDQTLVYADLPANKSLRLTLDGRPALLGGDPAPAEQPLLERAWTQARIERLLHLRETAHANDDDLRRALVHEIVDLSVKHRVLSPYTAMLVLETDFDYARFGLDRKALANILTVGPGGLEVAARARSTSRGERDVLATRKPDLDVERPLEPGEEHEFDGPDAQPGDVPNGVVGGVAGGVAGGIPGGVAGGVIGGVPSPENEVAQLSEIPSNDAPLRVAIAPPPPAPRIVPSGGAVAETITVAGRPDHEEDEEKEQRAAPYTGRFAEVMKHLATGRIAQARALAESWNAKEPGDVLALLALGEAWEAAGEKTAAARAYGSLIDLFPSRADMRRLAGERLERLGEAGLDLAIDSYQKAVLERPDHPTGHRLLAWALLRAGRYEAAFEALEKGIEQEYPQGRFAGLDRVLQGDLGLLGAAWLRHEPAKRDEVLDRLQSHDAHLDREPSLRFVLTWETDANDVDLHVFDRKGAHAYYNQKTLPSGGELYEDVTTGYGPECFAIDDPANRDAAPYRLKVHYYRRGPMGYGMGTVQVIRNDGEGKITIEPRPFVVMADNAMVDLGTVDGRKGGGKAGR